MTVPNDLRAHHLHCAAHLARLRLEAEAETERGVPLPPALAQQVTQVTRMILAEAEAAGRGLVGSMAGSRRDIEAARFLAARLARMAAAAHAATAAAERGDAATLRRQLRWFDTLTSAMWTVQAALHPKPRRRTSTAPSALRAPAQRRLPRSTRFRPARPERGYRGACHRPAIPDRTGSAFPVAPAAGLAADLSEEYGFSVERRARGIQRHGACHVKCFPVHLVVVAAQEQINWIGAAGGGGHDHDNPGPGWAAASAMGPPQGGTPVGRALDPAVPATVRRLSRRGGVLAREHQRHSFSLASASA